MWSKKVAKETKKKKRGRERSCEGLLGPGIGKKLELLNK